MNASPPYLEGRWFSMRWPAVPSPKSWHEAAVSRPSAQSARTRGTMEVSISTSLPSGATSRCAGWICATLRSFIRAPLKGLAGFAMGGPLAGGAGQVVSPRLGRVGDYTGPHERLDPGELVERIGGRAVPGGDAGGAGA